ncbi:hypothetical protein [Clostridium pasteurianum]|uniref:Uncharacterized protein n=1 Tax=Clostridium pasteurianum BC1 TaxID=86416 RepID=R4K8L2_CLOPA|nr:hypothetical protein [Clostridium pasteurianum]AGK98016.1 hypothetical protein Clopa_3204 [Clostridium pasteurianum BC1]
MKLKWWCKNLILYSILIIIFVILFNRFGIINKINRYINFETTLLKFQDLLSITITVLAVFVGAIITVATVLISMCDRRIIRLITKNDKAAYLISCIKISISTGLAIIMLLAIIYARLDFNIYIARLILLYIVGYLMLIFISKSKLLIHVVLSILNESFKGYENFIDHGDFKKPKK